MSPYVEPTVGVVTYGSLQSVRGLRDGSESLLAHSPLRLWVPAVSRGFGQPARSGRHDQRLAMVLRCGATWPLQGYALPLGIATPRDAGVGALALQVRPKDLDSLAGREGCTTLFGELQELTAERSPLQLLVGLAAAAGSFEQYQRALAAEVSTWASSYVPTPMLVHQGEVQQWSYVFVSPTLTHGGKAPAQLSPLRDLGGALAHFGAAANGQVTYYGHCLLGGVHGVPVHDLVRPDHPQGRLHYSVLNDEIADAVSTWFEGDAAAYKNHLGLPQMNIHLTKLEDALEGMDEGEQAPSGPDIDPGAPARF